MSSKQTTTIVRAAEEAISRESPRLGSPCVIPLANSWRRLSSRRWSAAAAGMDARSMVQRQSFADWKVGATNSPVVSRGADAPAVAEVEPFAGKEDRHA
jgi:hypothetical protein